MASNRLLIICEGPSEENFVNIAIAPYLLSRNPEISSVGARVIGKAGKKGGNVSYDRLKKDITLIMKEDKQLLVTTFIDYYGIKDIETYPDFNKTTSMKNPYEIVSTLEDGIYEALQFSRLIPYIQLHEFEMLYFSKIDKFIATDEKMIEKQDIITNKMELIVKDIGNVELINNSKETAPSKRLEKMLNEVVKIKLDKPGAAELFARNCNVQYLDEIRTKCRHFNDWLSKLEKVGTNHYSINQQCTKTNKVQND